MLNDLHIVFIGLGLMGGSLARALRPHAASLRVVDLSETTRAMAVAEGVADAAYAELGELTISADDLLILATPVKQIVQTIEQLPRHAPSGCLVMDLGSTKTEIIHAMSQLPGWFQAIGAHPMCGREVSGFAQSSADLYRHQTFILTPTVRTTPYLREVATAVAHAAQANPLIVPPGLHDHTVALISHLPYLLSALLMELTFDQAKSNPAIWPVSATGFRDMSRLSGSDPRMMHDILLTNRDAVLDQLRRYEQSVQALISWLELAGSAEIYQKLGEIQSHYHIYRQNKAW